eukprot:scaffold68661_cov54-Phaeocystis_antarctica.AAC.2
MHPRRSACVQLPQNPRSGAAVLKREQDRPRVQRHGRRLGAPAARRPTPAAAWSPARARVVLAAGRAGKARAEQRWRCCGCGC